MEDIPISCISWPDEELQPANDDEVRRLIILDGPNVICGTSSRPHQNTENSNENEGAGVDVSNLSVAGLLSLVRFFVRNDFDVMVFVSKKYTLNKFSANRLLSLKELIDLDVVVETEPNMLDDIMMLEQAALTDGVVLSNDNFKDHLLSESRFNAIVTTNSCSIRYKNVDPLHRHTKTVEGHYIADHLVDLPRHASYFSTSKCVRHELAEEYRELWSEDRKYAILHKIDECLLEIRKIVMDGES